MCLCVRWMGQMERTYGCVRCILTSTGPSVVWTKEQAETGTVCCPILAISQPSTNTKVSFHYVCCSTAFRNLRSHRIRLRLPVWCVCSGLIRWQKPQPSGLRSTVPVLSVPDLDGHKVNDVALVASDSTQVNIRDVIYYCCIALLFTFSSIIIRFNRTPVCKQ